MINAACLIVTDIALVESNRLTLHCMNATSLAGWFAKDPNILCRVGHVLLQVPFAVQRVPRQMILAEDCFQLLKIPIYRVSQVVIKATEKLYGSKFSQDILACISACHHFFNLCHEI